MLKKKTRCIHFTNFMDDERRHRMDERERVRQVISDELREGRVMTWERGDRPKDEPKKSKIREQIKDALKAIGFELKEFFK